MPPPVEEWQDVRMAQGRRDLDFHHKPLGAEHGGEFGFEALDGDLAVVSQVRGEIHRGHAARAELALDALTAG